MVCGQTVNLCESDSISEDGAKKFNKPGFIGIRTVSLFNDGQIRLEFMFNQ